MGEVGKNTGMRLMKRKRHRMVGGAVYQAANSLVLVFEFMEGRDSKDKKVTRKEKESINLECRMLPR